MYDLQLAGSMSTAIQSLWRKGRSIFSASDAAGKNHDGRSAFIFPKVDPAVEGPDCDKDCGSCTIHYPAGFKIDEEDELYGHVNEWATHLLVATGKTDWVRDVEDEKGSVMEALGKSSEKPQNGKLMLSASNMPPPPEYYNAALGRQPTTVLLLPAFKLIDQVRPSDIPELIQRFVNVEPTTTTPLLSNGTPSTAAQSISASSSTSNSIFASSTNNDIPAPSTAATLQSRPCPHKYLILLCSQRTRDARCGQSAPLLRRELERHLRPLGLHRDFDDSRPGGVGIYFISHVGGHKYSANMMIYRRNSAGEVAQGIWLARVRPEDCEGIVKYTVLQGKVVKPERQLRGGFDRAKGVVSW